MMGPTQRLVWVSLQCGLQTLLSQQPPQVPLVALVQPEHAEQEEERPEIFFTSSWRINWSPVSERSRWFLRFWKSLHILCIVCPNISSIIPLPILELCAILLKPFWPFTCWNSASKTSRCACIRRNSDLKAPKRKRTISPSAAWRRLARYLEQKKVQWFYQNWWYKNLKRVKKKQNSSESGSFHWACNPNCQRPRLFNPSKTYMSITLDSQSGCFRK